MSWLRSNWSTTRGMLLVILALQAAVFWVPLAAGVRPMRYTSDSSLPAILSFCNLVVTGVVCWRTYRLRRSGGPFGWSASATIWALMAVGFVFLGIDEVARIHENLGAQLRRLAFNDEETLLSSRLDDLIIGTYGLIGAATVVGYRREFLPFRGALRVVALGFCFMFGMVVLDVLTHNREILEKFIADPKQVRFAFVWLSVLEEQFKLLAEGVFLGAFIYCLRVSRGLSPVSAFGMTMDGAVPQPVSP